MISSKSRSDWYSFDRARVLPELSGVPGKQFTDYDNVLLHRTHLPLLGADTGQWRDTVQSRSEFDRTCKDWALRGDYQHDGRDFIRSRVATMLCDQQRLGKTVQIISAWEGRQPLLVVAPKPVRPVWLRWIHTVYPEAKIACAIGKTFDRDMVRGADAIFCHFDLISDWSSCGVSKTEMFVIDEGHLLSNRKSNRTKGCEFAATKAEKVVLATGTPYWNRLAGMYPLLKILSPGAWGNYTAFTKRYCSGHEGDFGWTLGEPSYEDELAARLKELVLRRTHLEVRGELPPLDISIEVADLTRKQIQELDNLEIVVGPAALSMVQVGQEARMRRLLGNLKIKAAVDCVKRFLESDESVVVWTWHKDVAYEIAKKLRSKHQKAYVATGDDDLEEVQMAWEADGTAALVLTMGVGQLGIDLSKARHCVFAEIDFTPAVVDQARMRTFSADWPCTETYILADHSIDRRLVSTVVRKMEEGRRLGIPAAEGELDIMRLAFEEEAPDLEAVVRGFENAA